MYVPSDKLTHITIVQPNLRKFNTELLAPNEAKTKKFENHCLDKDKYA